MDVAAFPFGDLADYTDIGSDHWYRLTSCTCAGAEGPHGILQPHPAPDGTWCGGAVTFAGHYPGERANGQPGPTWTVVSLDPLHIEPSLLCTVCGDHGFIRGGWVAA